MDRLYSTDAKFISERNRPAVQYEVSFSSFQPQAFTLEAKT